MIDLELWRARIGLYHSASVSRRSKRVKNLFRGVHLSTTVKWATKENLEDIPFALRHCVAALSILLVIQCAISLIKKQRCHKTLGSCCEALFRVSKSVLTSGVPLLLKVCVVMIPLLLLLAGDVERNPGPIEGTRVLPQHVPELVSILHKIADKWDLFINQLGMPLHIVDCIKNDEANSSEFSSHGLLAGLQLWVNSDDIDDATYENIAIVLRGDFLKNQKLADEVEAFAERIKDNTKQRAEEVREECSTLSAEIESQGTDGHSPVGAYVGLSFSCNPATEAVRSMFSELIQAVEDPSRLADEFFQAQLVSVAMLDDMSTLGVKKYDKSRTLMMSLQARLQNNPSDFETFMSVFWNSSALSPGIAGKLKQAYLQFAVPGNSRKSEAACTDKAPSKCSTLQCGCKKCPLFKTDKCAAPIPITFPVMTKFCLTEEKMIDLATETIEIGRKFNTLVSKMLESFKERKVPQCRLLSSVMALNSFTPLYEGQHRPLLYKLRNDLRQTKSVYETMLMMSDYFSFFDFYVIEHIIDFCGSDIDKGEMQSYKASFKDYLERRIYELPSKLAQSCDNHVKLVVKLDSEYDEYTAKQLKLFQKTLAKTFQVSEGVLCLHNIESGCFELTFQMPTFIAEEIFPLSDTQEGELAVNHILRLTCDSYHWPHKDCQESTESDGGGHEPQDDDGEPSLPVLLEHVRVGSKRDPPEKTPDDTDSAIGTSISGTNYEQSTTFTAAESVAETLKELRQIKERDEEDARRKDKPQLHLLAYEGDLETIKTIINSEDGNPDTVDDYGMTPLHKAVFGGHIDITKYLIQEASCQPACQGNTGRTPLHIAAMYGHLDIVKYLVEEVGLEPLVMDDTKCTPLHSSIFHGHIAVTQYLANEITKYKTVSLNDLRIKSELTPLHLAANDGHTVIVKYLTSIKESDPNVTDDHGYTPLHYAAHNGHIEIVKYLVDVQHANVMCTGKDGFTPLHFAATKGQLSVVRYLAPLESCDIRAADPMGHTPLHCAAIDGHLSVVDYLVNELNDDVSRPNVNGANVVHMAAQQGHLNLMKFLVEVKHCNPMCTEKTLITPIHLAAQEGNLEILRYLLESGCELNPKDIHGRIPLDYAAINGQLGAMKMLLIDSQRDIASDNGRTAVHYAAQKGHLDIVKYLVDNQHWNPLHPDTKSSCTPLHVAANEGHLNVVRYFVREKNCDPICREALQNTPLHLAAFNGHLDIVKFYIEDLQVSPEIKGCNDMRAFDLAVFTKQRHVVQYLASWW